MSQNSNSAWLLKMPSIGALLRQASGKLNTVSILLIASEGPAYDAIAAEARKVGATCASISSASTEREVAQAIALHSPNIVVCAPKSFGWISKLAFVAGCLTVYTCGDDGEGTLLERAAHFEMHD